MLMNYIKEQWAHLLRYQITPLHKKMKQFLPPATFRTGLHIINLLKPNNIYMSYRSATLQTLHFKYLFNKYTY